MPKVQTHERACVCVSAVLWLPLPATEHDAGLCSDRDLPAGYSPEPH